MISWMQTVMQKHYKWLFSILLVVIIIAFVFTIGASPGIVTPSQQDMKVEFYGFNLRSDADMRFLSEGAEISYYLNTARSLPGSETERVILERAVLLHMADQLHIPGPSETQFGNFLRSKRAFQNPATGQFSNDRYTQFLDIINNNPNLSQERVTLILADDFRIDKLMSALSGPGYVQPLEALLEAERREILWTIAVATADRDQFQLELTVDEAKLEAFYEQNQFRYERPEQVEVSYLFFPADAYLNKAGEPTEAQVESLYRRNPQHFGTDAEGNPKPLTEVHEAVVEAWKKDRASRLAVEAAAAVEVMLYEEAYARRISQGSDSLRQLLADKELELRKLEPFSERSLPRNAPIPAEGLSHALRLTPDRFYSSALSTPEGAALLLLENIIPASIPSLQDIHAAVEADYKNTERNRLFAEQGKVWQEALQEAATSTETFETKARELDMRVGSYEPFTLMTPPEGVDAFVLRELMAMNEGEVSPMQTLGGEGTFIFVASKEIPTLDPDSPEVRMMLEQLTYFSAGATGQTILNDLVVRGERSAEDRL